LFSSRVEWKTPTPLKLRGLSRRNARDLRDTVERERERVLAAIRLAALIEEFDQLASRVCIWARDCFEIAKSAPARSRLAHPRVHGASLPRDCYLLPEAKRL
jgi:DNA helicase IV